MLDLALNGATAALLVTMLFGLVRAILGPTFYDRLLAVNLFGTKTVLLIAVIGFVMGRPEWLDIALAYAMINFIGTIAALRFVERRDFGEARLAVSEKEDSSP
ncbi:MAG TPA: monovalent cation/H+ antiporter complex subunit F [Candidatus Macondimonas sp.]|nr:monovalent cation/H+ antiporter complex subunit F [Candidatus Macondimonas sp.]